MSNYYKDIWPKLARPPAHALRRIGGGRLAGMTDISPQWRYEVMTEVFGPCGIDWKYTIDRLWTEPGSDGQVFCFAQVSVYVRNADGWADPVVGVGGNFLIEKERGGLHNNDEGFKMCVTDALGTAMKMLGVASEIYAGRWEGSKYKDKPEENGKQQPKPTWGGGTDEHQPISKANDKPWSKMTEKERVDSVMARIKVIEANTDKKLAAEDLKKLGTNPNLATFSEANQVKIRDEMFRVSDQIQAALA